MSPSVAEQVADVAGALAPRVAEMSADEKHAVSHRGRAFRALASALSDRAPAH